MDIDHEFFKIRGDWFGSHFFRDAKKIPSLSNFLFLNSYHSVGPSKFSINLPRPINVKQEWEQDESALISSIESAVVED